MSVFENLICVFILLCVLLGAYKFVEIIVWVVTHFRILYVS